MTGLKKFLNVCAPESARAQNAEPVEWHIRPALAVVPDLPAFTVRLSRKDFLYYTWVLALRRPLLPFLLYSFALLFLLGATGVWPAARVFSLAVFVPLLGYLLWVWVAAQTLWSRYPPLKEPHHYRFKARIPAGHGHGKGAGGLRRPEAGSDIYLLRHDGSADILPRTELPEELEDFLAQRLEVKRSSFLWPRAGYYEMVLGGIDRNLIGLVGQTGLEPVTISL